ncbi:MAG: cellulose-binding protein [Frankiales bacterium]|nr:cellulose-binding protein [Frankiales bacterium]
MRTMLRLRPAHLLLALLPGLLTVVLDVRSPANAVAVTPSVSVAGTSLVDGAGQPLRLLGVDRSGSEYACAQGWGIFDGPTDTTAIDAMASWHINAVRVPLNEDCWLGINGVAPSYSGTAYRDAISGYVTRLHAAGLIAVLDLHWSAPGTALATGQQVMADADHSPDFWSSVAAHFVADPGVVFDLYNEPHDISWSCWRDGCTTADGWRAAGMQSLLDAVRATGARQPVLANGNQWAGDLSGWLAYRPVDPVGQLAAGVHLYNFSRCNSTQCWDTEVAPVAAVVPVVTSELGEDDCSGGFVTAYMSWADVHQVSYLGWTWNTWDCRSGPALISAWDGTPTAFGAAVQAHLAAVTAIPAPTPTPTPTQTSVPAPISSVSTRLLTAGQALTVNAVATPGQVVNLLAKSAPSTSYRVIRTSTVPASGSLSWTDVKPTTNSAFQVLARDTGSVSAAVDVQVRSAVSLAARRTSVRRWTFYGTVTPNRNGQLVTVYQVSSNGSLSKLGSGRTNSYGQYAVPLVFPTSASRTFVAGTAADSLNAAGQSPRVTLSIT